jgi:hypothetical protein
MLSRERRFHYVDERTPEGKPAAEAISGASYAEMYWELANETKQSKWLVTFTKERGRVDLVGRDYEGRTREDYCGGR